MTDQKHDGLPVHGYKPQHPFNIALVNYNKEMEERLLRTMDQITGNPDFDQLWLDIARTQMQQAFMALNRAIFCPGRVSLPGDEE